MRMFPTQPPMESAYYALCTIFPGDDVGDDTIDLQADDEVLKYAHCSERKLLMSDLIVGLHVLAGKIWEPCGSTEFLKSASFDAAPDLR